MMNWIKAVLLLSVILFNFGCAQKKVQSEEVKNQVADTTAAGEELEPELSDQAVQTLRTLIDTVEKDLESGIKSDNEITQFRNDKVKFWFNYFTVKDKARFQRYLNRGQQYREMVQTILEENEIPNELYFLAMIESGYATHAYSRASAVGVWQFIAATGRRYGLAYDYYIDERRDPIQATEGAVRYLRDLYNAFLSWELAMAAYNAGELRVLRTIMDGQTRDFWAMTHRKRLPKETRNYVPKFIAAAIIGRNPEKYGFTDPSGSVDPYPSVEAYEVPSPMRLRDFAKTSGVPYDMIKKLNPHIRRGITPGNKRTYEIWIPSEHLAKVKEKATQIAKLKLKGSNIDDDTSIGKYHVVRRGENLSVIAKRYRISLGSLKRINGLTSSRIYPGKKLRISTASYKRPKSGGSRYLVRNGDSLGLIAQRYNTSVSALRRVNGLRNNTIRIGQRLVIPGHTAISAGKKKYKVRRGDTLEKVARRHGLSIRQLKSINGIKRNTIYIGEWLKVSAGI